MTPLHRLPTRLKILIACIREPLFGVGFWIDHETIWVWPHKRPTPEYRYHDITFNCGFRTRDEQRRLHRDYEAVGERK